MMRKRLLAGLAAAGILLGGAGWLAVSAVQQARLDAAIDSVFAAGHFPDSSADFHARIDAVRQFIHAHSDHKIDDAFYRDWKRQDVQLSRLAAAAREGAEKPHLECSTRAGLMEILLRRMGYETRSIVLFKPLPPDFPSHSVLEVRNPVSGAWELQDPDMNVYWTRARDGQRVGVLELLGLDLAAASPCRGEADCAPADPYSVGSVEETNGPFLSLALIRVSSKERQLYAQRARMGSDPAAVLTAYCAALPKNCRTAPVEISAP